MTKYRCVHCNNVFDLADEEFKRCPKCFWTTSLVRALGSMAPARPSVGSQAKKARPAFPIVPIVSFLAAVLLIGGGAYWLWQNKDNISSSIQTKASSIHIAAPAEKAKPKKAKAPAPIFTPEEKATLNTPFKLTIPRQLSEDEENILKKQVSSPVILPKPSTLTLWKLEDFDKMLQEQQKLRKIPFGWGYMRSLKQLFRETYLPATVDLETGNFEAAREKLIRSLAFPIYQNNPLRHRSVALVMLRPFINDTLGKIAIINQYLVNQGAAEEAGKVYQGYQELISTIELNEWDKASAAIEVLTRQIAGVEARADQSRIAYPPAAMQLLDPEVHTAVLREATPPEGGSINLKPILIDLGLKGTVVKQNRPAELTAAQKQYEVAMTLIAEEKWSEARETLGKIGYPPELAQDAKRKMAMLDRAIAMLDESASKQL